MEMVFTAAGQDVESWTDRARPASTKRGRLRSDALAYAKARAAEMVGKKWENGGLVDNPDARWVITDATRDEIWDIIGLVFAGDLKSTELPKALMDAGAFSRDRVNLIARTETMAANGQGALAGYKSAREIGVMVKKGLGAG
jgi:hypothetical protein